METPQPVDVSRLHGILANSKRIMEKEAAEKPVSRGRNEPLPPRGQDNDGMYEGMIDSNKLIDASQIPANAPAYQEKPLPQAPQPKPQMTEALKYNDSMVDNSNFSPEVKRAMKEHNMSQVDTQSFSLEGMEDLIEQPTRVNEQVQQTQQVQQTNIGDEQQLRKIIREELLSILGGEFTKKIRENTIKSTIQTLIKEGKVTTTSKKK